MGSLFRLPVPRYESVEPLLVELEAQGVSTVGAVSRGGEPIAHVEPASRKLAIFLGSEALGLPESLARGLDHRATIPMASEVDSLSVNAAAAIATTGWSSCHRMVA